MKTRLDEMRKIKSIGKVSQLKTDNKKDLVVAINEIKMDSDSKVSCKDYDGSSGVNIPPMSSGMGGCGITPVGLQFKWVGTKLGIKRENAYSYTFADLKGEPGEQGRDGAPGTRGDRGPKGDSGFPSKKDWQALLQRVKALEYINDIQPSYEHAEITYIADILTASDRTVNINYGILSKKSAIKHELSTDGGVTFQAVTPTESAGFYTIRQTFEKLKVGQFVNCVIRVVTSDGECNYSNLFTITVSDTENVENELAFSIGVTKYEVKDNESIIVKFNSNKNISEVLLSINGGDYCHKGIIEGDKVVFVTGRLMEGTYTCKMKVHILSSNTDNVSFESDEFSVVVSDDYESVPAGNVIIVSSLEPRRYIDENGTIVKNSLSFRFKVNPEAVSEARYFYYKVDRSSFSPLDNVKYLGNGVYEAHISWVFDPFGRRKIEVLCSRLKRRATQNNKGTTFKEFMQDYNADIVFES